MTTREHVLEVAKLWLKTPYHHRAMVRGAGVDCAMFLLAVYNEAGVVPVMDVEDYPPDFMLHRDDERLLSYVEKHAFEIETPLPGDAVLYRVGRSFAHGGIVVDWPLIIHSRVGVGVVYEEGDMGKLSARPRRFWRPNAWRTEQ